MRMAFCKEDCNTILTEYSRVMKEIVEIQDSKIKINNSVEVIVRHRFYCTMVDGKIINAVCKNAATSRCPVCLAGPKTLNNLPSQTNADVLKFGISPLHAKINSMEFLLRCSYKLASTKEEQETKKKIIQKQFKEKTGLNIGKPKPGFGISHDGNTARRFFQNSKVTSEIIGIELPIIERFSNVLAAISCNRIISPESYENYARETAELFHKTYPQFTFSPTVHKILYHGHEYMKQFPFIPVGALSEEPQEARNKDFKRYRTDFSRKISRKDTLEDIFNRFMLTSDPLFFFLFKKFQLSSKTTKKDENVHLPLDFLNEETSVNNAMMGVGYDMSSDEDNSTSNDEDDEITNEFEDGVF
ncbi:uncharacterized protein LOC115879646 isoform X2 [Sitophilus oryzae]|uniref:Uncharacterized protein LOC115879646 isoform X2 n=2 Tax=Sitophilus oryzae TaxID=7048 RepID=A0A6J2XMW5_SITOR|nr:uncharacterized protein LOC115879646 isoform X2 [Sitophilus oryzae]